MKIQLPFGRTVDTDAEPPEETEEVKKAREETEKHTKEAGKDGSLTQVLLGLGAFVTAKELFPQEKLDAAAKLLEKLKEHAELGLAALRNPDWPLEDEEIAIWKGDSSLKDCGLLLAAVGGAITDARASGDTDKEELLTQIILPDLRDEIRKEIRYTIDPAAKERDEKVCTCDEHSECAGCPPADEDEQEKANPASDGYTYAPGEVPQFIFDVYRDDEIGWCFIIEPVKHWQAKHCVSDCYSTEERKVLEPILKQAGLIETMESTYELLGGSDDASEAIQALEAAGLKQDAEFTKWLEEHREE